MSTVAVWPAIPEPKIMRTHSFGPRHEATRMETSRVRKRRTYTDALELVEVLWHFTQDEFDTFKTFFEVELVNGSARFEMDHYSLEEDPPSLVTLEYTFWEGYSFNRSDNLFAVSATLELAPPEPADPPPEPDLCEIDFNSDTDGISGDSFQCYTEEDPVTETLNSGNGWDGEWNGAYNWLGVQALEPFQSYTDQDPVLAVLDKGFGWDAEGNLSGNYLGLSARDFFESYDLGSITGPLLTGGLLFAPDSNIATNIEPPP